MPENCSTCKYHSATKRPKVISGVYDTLVEFADDDETVFHCKHPDGPHAGKEVGTVPVHCDAFAAGTTGVDSALDAAMKRWQDRRRNNPYPQEE